MSKLERTTLVTRTGHTLEFTSLGFGAAEVGNMGYVLPSEAAEATLDAAWTQGLRYFDTAPLYGLGLSERRLGAALAARPRSEVLVSTKVGLPLPADTTLPIDVDFARIAQPASELYDYSYDAIMRSVDASLKRLGMDHVDILYVHDIDARTHGSADKAERHLQVLRDSGWRALDQLRQSGAVKAIGAGLNEWELCERMLQAFDPDLFLLAGRYTLLNQASLASFLPACVEMGVGVVVGGPFNSGILATGTKAEVPVYDYDLAPRDIVTRVEEIERICDRHGVLLPQAALQFPMRHPAVYSVIPGCMSPQQTIQNATLMMQQVPEQLWADLAKNGLVPA